MVNADGPGIEVIFIPSFKHLFTNNTPGSEIHGVPLSVIRAIVFFSFNNLIIPLADFFLL